MLLVIMLLDLNGIEAVSATNNTMLVQQHSQSGTSFSDR